MRAIMIPYLTGSPDRFQRLAKIGEVTRAKLQVLENFSDLESFLKHNQTPVLITDCDLEDGSWRDVLELCKLFAPETRVVVTASTDSASLWAEVVEAGAFDLLAQPFYAPEVRRCLRASMELQNQEQLVEATI